jgi:LuxR family transcriptional regulator, maltose regulon positive regulatory protein
MTTNAEAISGPPIRRGKLRLPQPGRGLVLRPRLTARLDRSLQVPLTLVSAPAGFGKTTLLTEWAASQTIPLAWLALDAGDRNLEHLATHIIAVIETLVPGVTAPVRDLLRRPLPAPAAEIGICLADALLDLAHDVVLVVDDYHVAASRDVERFLGGLLQSIPPLFHLLLATRSDPALPLARMRLHGHVNELRAADLRFSDEEARALLATAGRVEDNPALVAALQQQTGGWIAGLRLATLALPVVEDLVRINEIVAGNQHLMDFLVEEVLATQPVSVQDFLLRTAIVDRICAPLADTLLDLPQGDSQAVLERLSHESLFLEPTDDGEWLRYHPLFHSLLLHQLEVRLRPQEIAALHARASTWFAARGFLDLAIQHSIAAGDMAGTATLVELHVSTALDREDWNTVASWLRLLPEAIIASRPTLLLAKGWVSHFSGRSVPIRTMLSELNALLMTLDADRSVTAALEAERDILSFAAIGARFTTSPDPHEVVAFLRRTVEQTPAHHRLAAGLANFWLGCALQAIGRTDEALRWLTGVVEHSEERIDAGSIRALGGLMFVHRQAGNIRACEAVARHTLALAERHGLPVAAGWARWMLGWLAYERDELAIATEHFSAAVADYRRVHLHCACEAMFGQALVYQAQGMPADAASTLSRLLEIIFDSNALEYLPLFRGFEARLALLQGEPRRAIDWLQIEDGVTIESNALDAFDHAFLTQIKVLLAEGSDESLARAWRVIEEFRTYTEARHHGAHQVEMLALSALVLDARGETEPALAALQRSVELAAHGEFFRTFVDLGPALTALLRQLAAHVPSMSYLHHLLGVLGDRDGSDDPEMALTVSVTPDVQVFELLTVREVEVLECLHRRLSYQEIGRELFISPQTVKSHVANVYAKLGVGNRRQALVIAQSLGWAPQT